MARSAVDPSDYGSKAIAGLSLIFSLCLTACNPCETHQQNRQVIDIDGTIIFVQYTHCSALNNSVDFYIKQPGIPKIILGRGSDLEEFTQSYDDASHTITLLTPDPSDISLMLTKVDHYKVRKAALRYS